MTLAEKTPADSIARKPDVYIAPLKSKLDPAKISELNPLSSRAEQKDSQANLSAQSRDLAVQAPITNDQQPASTNVLSMNAAAARLARELRRSDKDLVVELGDENFRLKKSFEAADKLGARYILIVGEDELRSDTFTLKNLSTGEQVSVPRSALAAKIRN
jgi:histidyl-tRNA synthetase